MSEFTEEVSVEIRRNGSGSVLAYVDRERAVEAFENHRAVLRSLYDLVDRRHGADGETVARLEVVDGGIGEILVREEFVRDIGADRAITLADDMRYHAERGELVTDGGEGFGGEVEHKPAEDLGEDSLGFDYVRCGCGQKYPSTSSGCPVAPGEVDR